MHLEMPYLMNVILYLPNPCVSNLPFISKNCFNACNAMKINPWADWSKDPLNDLTRVFQVFPKIQTLRIDLQSLQTLQDIKEITSILMIEVIHDTTNINTYKLKKSILNKFTSSFDGIIRQRTKKLYLNDYQINYVKVKQINTKSTLRFVQIQPQTINYQIIQVLNSIKQSIPIKLDVNSLNIHHIRQYIKDFNSNIFICYSSNEFGLVLLNNELHTFCISPLKSLESMELFEKYYIPTSLQLGFTNKLLYDFRTFQHVQKVTITYHEFHQVPLIQLPTSIQILDYHFSNGYFNLNISNWNDLINLKTIYHYDNLDIAYPQIKYEHSYNLPIKKNFTDSLFGKVLLMLCCYLLIPQFTLVCLFVFSTYFGYLLKVLILEMFVYFLLFTISVLIVMTLMLIVKKSCDIVPPLALLSFGIISMIYTYSLQYYTSTFWFPFSSSLVVPSTIIALFSTFIEVLDIHRFQILKCIRFMSGNWIKAKWVVLVYWFVHKYENFFFISFIFLTVSQVGFGLLISLLSTTGFIHYVCMGCSIFVGSICLFVISSIFLN